VAHHRGRRGTVRVIGTPPPPRRPALTRTRSRNHGESLEQFGQSRSACSASESRGQRTGSPGNSKPEPGAAACGPGRTAAGCHRHGDCHLLRVRVHAAGGGAGRRQRRAAPRRTVASDSRAPPVPGRRSLVTSCPLALSRRPRACHVRLGA
jgi:hypothetical protein